LPCLASACFALGFALLAAGGCRKTTPRSAERTAGALTEHVAAPRWREVRARSAALVAAARALEATPSAASLTAARAALREALLAVEAARPLRMGVVDDQNLLLGATYWPIRPASIEAAIEGEAPLDAAAVALAGSHQRGLYALEYLLFPPGAAPSAGPTAEAAPRDVTAGLATSPRRRRYVALVAGVAADALQRLAAQIEVQASLGRCATRLALGALLNDLIDAIEAQVVRADLRPAARPGARTAARLPGEASGAAVAATAIVLGAARAVMEGPPEGGLRALVESRAPEIAGRLVEALARAEVATSAARPSSGPAQAAALRAFEVILKTEVIAALGVTRTFRSIDGD
jgi:predicted lipoprotein